MIPLLAIANDFKMQDIYNMADVERLKNRWGITKRWLGYNAAIVRQNTNIAFSHKKTKTKNVILLLKYVASLANGRS